MLQLVWWMRSSNSNGTAPRLSSVWPSLSLAWSPPYGSPLSSGCTTTLRSSRRRRANWATSSWSAYRCPSRRRSFWLPSRRRRRVGRPACFPASRSPWSTVHSSPRRIESLAFSPEVRKRSWRESRGSWAPQHRYSQSVYSYATPQFLVMIILIHRMAEIFFPSSVSPVNILHGNCLVYHNFERTQGANKHLDWCPINYLHTLRPLCSINQPINQSEFVKVAEVTELPESHCEG